VPQAPSGHRSPCIQAPWAGQYSNQFSGQSRF